MLNVFGILILRYRLVPSLLQAPCMMPASEPAIMNISEDHSIMGQLSRRSLMKTNWARVRSGNSILMSAETSPTLGLPLLNARSRPSTAFSTDTQEGGWVLALVSA